MPAPSSSAAATSTAITSSTSSTSSTRSLSHPPAIMEFWRCDSWNGEVASSELAQPTSQVHMQRRSRRRRRRRRRQEEQSSLFQPLLPPTWRREASWSSGSLLFLLHVLFFILPICHGFVLTFPRTQQQQQQHVQQRRCVDDNPGNPRILNPLCLSTRSTTLIGVPNGNYPNRLRPELRSTRFFNDWGGNSNNNNNNNDDDDGRYNSPRRRRGGLQQQRTKQEEEEYTDWVASILCESVVINPRSGRSCGAMEGMPLRPAAGNAGFIYTPRAAAAAATTQNKVNSPTRSTKTFVSSNSMPYSPTWSQSRRMMGPAVDASLQSEQAWKLSNTGAKCLVVILPILGDLESLEYGELLAAVVPALKQAHIYLRVIGIGSTLESAQQFAHVTGLPLEYICLDPTAALHQALELHQGPNWDTTKLPSWLLSPIQWWMERNYPHLLGLEPLRPRPSSSSASTLFSSSSSSSSSFNTNNAYSYKEEGNAYNDKYKEEGNAYNDKKNKNGDINNYPRNEYENSYQVSSNGKTNDDYEDYYDNNSKSANDYYYYNANGDNYNSNTKNYYSNTNKYQDDDYYYSNNNADDNVDYYDDDEEEEEGDYSYDNNDYYYYEQDDQQLEQERRQAVTRGWINYLAMWMGIAAPDTMREILRGYTGDRKAPERVRSNDVLKVENVLEMIGTTRFRFLFNNDKNNNNNNNNDKKKPTTKTKTTPTTTPTNKKAKPTIQTKNAKQQMPNGSPPQEQKDFGDEENVNSETTMMNDYTSGTENDNNDIRDRDDYYDKNGDDTNNVKYKKTWWQNEQGYQRPLELASVRLRHLLHWWDHFEEYVPDPSLLAWRGCTLLLEARSDSFLLSTDERQQWRNGGGGKNNNNMGGGYRILYEHRSTGVLSYTATPSRPLSFLEPYIGPASALNPLGLRDEAVQAWWQQDGRGRGGGGGGGGRAAFMNGGRAMVRRRRRRPPPSSSARPRFSRRYE
ncbi:hypothetical protein ACA910_008722 [Epithemia clementina (nom. ined.)]